MSSTLNPKYWDYFRAVEDDLLACARYVEFTSQNLPTYSNEFARILMVAGAEVDSVLREMCERLDPSSPSGNITQYCPIVTRAHPYFNRVGLAVQRTHLSITPWANWTKDDAPPWWKAGFNKIKHDRSNHLEQGSLSNALHAVGGLYLAILHYHHASLPQVKRLLIGNASQLFVPVKAEDDVTGEYWFRGTPWDHGGFRDA